MCSVQSGNGYFLKQRNKSNEREACLKERGLWDPHSASCTHSSGFCKRLGNPDPERGGKPLPCSWGICCVWSQFPGAMLSWCTCGITLEKWLLAKEDHKQKVNEWGMCKPEYRWHAHTHAQSLLKCWILPWEGSALFLYACSVEMKLEASLGHSRNNQYCFPSITSKLNSVYVYECRSSGILRALLFLPNRPHNNA